MKKIKLFFAAVIFLAAASRAAYAATDCIYSAEYTYDSGFEGAPYDPNCGWIPYHSTATASAEIVTARSNGAKSVFEGSRAIRFSNVPGQGGGRGIYFKTGVSGQTVWKFNAGDTVEMSGMFRTDAPGGVRIWFGMGSDEFSGGKINYVGDGWVCIKARYTFRADGTGNFRINTDIDTDDGYIYADNISIKRVLYSGDDAASVRIANKCGVYASIDAKGNLYMWGAGSHGVLNAENTEVTKPMLKMTGVSDIALGDGHAVVLKKNGSVFSWGRNDCGQLGDGTVSDRAEPVLIARDIKSVAAGSAHTVIVSKDGCAYGVGRGFSSQYTDGVSSYLTSFAKVNANFYVNEAWASGEHTFLKSAEGYVYGIGYNGNAQLGNGSFLPQLKYEKISESRILDIDTTNSCTLCLGYDRVLYAAGFARHGQFGSESAYETLTAICNNADACSIGEATMFVLSGGKASVSGNKTGGLAGDGSLPVLKLSDAVSAVADKDVLYLSQDGDLHDMSGIIIKRESMSDDPFPEWDGENVILPLGLVFDLDGRIVYNAGSVSGGVNLFVAAYDESGNLVNISMTKNVNDEIVRISSFDCSASKYKVMIWSGKSGVIPIESAHLITFAEISAFGSKDGGIWHLNVSGKAPSIDGLRFGGAKVTLIAYNKNSSNDVSDICAMEQVNTDSDGSFEFSLPMYCEPADCILKVGISGEVLEKNIEK